MHCVTLQTVRPSFVSISKAALPSGGESLNVMHHLLADWHQILHKPSLGHGTQIQFCSNQTVFHQDMQHFLF